VWGLDREEPGGPPPMVIRSQISVGRRCVAAILGVRFTELPRARPASALAPRPHPVPRRTRQLLLAAAGLLISGLTGAAVVGSLGTTTAAGPPAPDTGAPAARLTPTTGTANPTPASRTTPTGSKPVIANLAQLQPVAGTLGANQSVTIAGQVYPGSASTRLAESCFETGSAEYFLSPPFRALAMTVAIEDRSTNPSTRVTVQVFANEELVQQVVVTFGKPAFAYADITDATVLTILWHRDRADVCTGDNYLAFAAPQLLP
jgi:hypothetical protein